MKKTYNDKSTKISSYQNQQRTDNRDAYYGYGISDRESRRAYKRELEEFGLSVKRHTPPKWWDTSLSYEDKIELRSNYHSVVIGTGKHNDINFEIWAKEQFDKDKIFKRDYLINNIINEK